jgi:hypothetical protein
VGCASGVEDVSMVGRGWIHVWCIIRPVAYAFGLRRIEAIRAGDELPK